MQTHDTTNEGGIERSTMTWRGIEVEISFERDWLGMPASDMHPSHLQLRSIADARVPLPITETGYLSHFVSAEAVDEAGGAVAYFTAWLEMAARSKGWRAQEATARQLALF